MEPDYAVTIDALEASARVPESDLVVEIATPAVPATNQDGGREAGLRAGG